MYFGFNCALLRAERWSQRQPFFFAVVKNNEENRKKANLLRQNSWRQHATCPVARTGAKTQHKVSNNRFDAYSTMSDSTCSLAPCSTIDSTSFINSRTYRERWMNEQTTCLGANSLRRSSSDRISSECRCDRHLCVVINVTLAKVKVESYPTTDIRRDRLRTFRFRSDDRCMCDLYHHVVWTR